MTNFHGDETKKNQNGRLKKNVVFQHLQKLSNFRQNIMDWSLLLGLVGLIHYLENKVGVVDFANAQELVMF